MSTQIQGESNHGIGPIQTADKFKEIVDEHEAYLTRVWGSVEAGIAADY